MSQRIVVCDDEPHITRAISMKLSKAGFDVQTFPDGQSAWEVIRNEPPSLIITDYQMPRMDGLELISCLREDEKLRDVPVFLLTAKGFELDENQMRQEHGVAEMIVKPFSPRGILECVQRYVGAASVTA